jgi:hypothetical protein
VYTVGGREITKHQKKKTCRRWLVEKGFGWLKQTGHLWQVRLRGLKKVDGCSSLIARRTTHQ